MGYDRYLLAAAKSQERLTIKSCVRWWRLERFACPPHHEPNERRRTVSEWLAGSMMHDSLRPAATFLPSFVSGRMRMTWWWGGGGGGGISEWSRSSYGNGRCCEIRPKSYPKMSWVVVRKGLQIVRETRDSGFGEERDPSVPLRQEEEEEEEEEDGTSSLSASLFLSLSDFGRMRLQVRLIIAQSSGW